MAVCTALLFAGAQAQGGQGEPALFCHRVAYKAWSRYIYICALLAMRLASCLLRALAAFVYFFGLASQHSCQQLAVPCSALKASHGNPDTAWRPCDACRRGARSALMRAARWRVLGGAAMSCKLACAATLQRSDADWAATMQSAHRCISSVEGAAMMGPPAVLVTQRV